MSESFQAPIGTRDVLPPESERWRTLLAIFGAHAERAGYGLVQTPLFEDLAVFQRMGASTDVVRKEMYSFEDKGGRHLALRPEGTASVVRAFVQHRPTLPWKVWYAAPVFRYERPQAGRYRQHHQLGIEVLGVGDPDVDVEVIAMATDLFSELGLRRVTLRLNSIGDEVCRPAYLKLLTEYLTDHRDELCDEHKEGAALAPLRVLDCKREACRRATISAPWTVDHLCDACQAHFHQVQAGLRSQEIDFIIEPRLVRGLDYYTRTTFELQAEALDAAQNTVTGGGRYDGLVEMLGGPPVPGIGFGMGIERLLLACDAEGVFPASPQVIDVFVVDVTDGSAARDLTARLRRQGVGADRSFDGRSMKSQMRQADRSGARLALIVGEDEAAAGMVRIRDLRQGGGQELVASQDVVAQVKARLG